MAKKIWINRADSFRKAEIFDYKYYQRMSRKERLEIIQFLREMYEKMRRGRRDACAKGLRRSIKVIQ